MDKNNNIYYFLFLVLLIGGLFIYINIEDSKNEEHPQITDLATEPDLLINTADRYKKDHKRLATISFLEDAIELMTLLEKDGDEVSLQAIEVGIHDLKVVKRHLKSGNIDESFMYEAFADALNSLAYASLRVSEGYIREGKNKEAKITINHALEHLQNSIKYAIGEQKEEEIKVISHLNAIIEKHLESDISEIDQVMAEIDSIVQSHIID